VAQVAACSQINTKHINTVWAEAGPLDARGKITVSGLPNRISYCVIFMVYAQFTYVAASRVTQPTRPHAVRGPRVGDPWPKYNVSLWIGINRLPIKFSDYCEHDNEIWAF
jgi:hypothetical protein